MTHGDLIVAFRKATAHRFEHTAESRVMLEAFIDFIENTCPPCAGKGWIKINSIRAKCTICDGKGSLQ